MATFATMITSVRAVLRDTEAAFISDALIGEWLNEAQLNLVARLSLLQTNVGGTTSVTGTITPPTDFIRVVSLGLDAETETGLPVIAPIYVSNEVFRSWADSDQIPDQYIFRVYEDIIDIYPVLSERDYVLEYIVKPAVMTGTDTPDIPGELHIRLINYARGHAKLMEGELAEADAYLKLYERGLPGDTTTNTRRFPGPFTLVPEPSYFD